MLQQSDRTHKLHWTGSKASLIELVYALQCGGVFNNGNADLKQIATYFEQAFDVELGNYYRVFQDFRIRKNSRTQFIDELKKVLEKRMDDTDEHPKQLK